MSKRFPLMRLTEELVTELWDELSQGTGYVSATTIARVMAERGYYNQYTGRPFTRVTIHNLLRRSSKYTSFRGSGDKRMPLIVTNPLYPNISKWLQDKYPHLPVIPFSEVELADVKGRDVYGYPPMACLLFVKHVYWPYYERRPILKDAVPSDESQISFRAVRCEMYPRPE